MNFLLLLLIIILIIVISLVLGNQIISGAYEPVIKFPYGRTEEFEEFINDDRYAAAIIRYIRDNSYDIWKTIIPDNIYVFREFIYGYSTHRKIADNQYDKWLKSNPGILEQEKTDNKQRIYEETMKTIQNLFNFRIDEIVSVITTFDQTYDKLIFPMIIQLPNSTELHATFILVDSKEKLVIFINPHYMQPDEHNADFKMIKDEVSRKLVGSWTFDDIKNYLKDDFDQCPVFQKSFQNDKFCYAWMFYLALLFVRNDIDEYRKIVQMYRRNNAWTKRQLQEFMFMIYKRFNVEIPEGDPEDFAGVHLSLSGPAEEQGFVFSYEK